MKVAIIEDSISYQDSLKKIIKDTTKWEVDFFSDASHFGRSANLHDYDIIIANFYLPGINGRDLIKSISNKTKAEFALMASENNWVSTNDLENEQISTIIDKSIPNNVFDAMKYLGAKKEINSCMETETENMKEIISLTNGTDNIKT